MKKLNFYSLILMFLFLSFSFLNVQAQVPPPQEIDNPQAPPRPNLMSELDLSPVQIQEMRRINRERRPSMQEAKRRFDEANRALDQAIYADAENEIEIQNRMNELQAAHTEMIKNRILLERAIRRILTPAQLARFRELREQFMRQQPFQNNMNPRRQRLRNLPKAMPRRQGLQARPKQN